MLAVDPDQALFNPRTMDELLAQQRWLLRVFSTMFAAFAIIALVLAAVGLYAVTAYAVTQHTRDIGVRMVLGAQPRQVIWLFLRRAFFQLAIGLSIGLAAAFGVGQLLADASGPNELPRPGHSDVNRRPAFFGCGRGVHLAGAARDPSRSAGRAAPRLARPPKERRPVPQGSLSQGVGGLPNAFSPA